MPYNMVVVSTRLQIADVCFVVPCSPVATTLAQQNLAREYVTQGEGSIIPDHPMSRAKDATLMQDQAGKKIWLTGPMVSLSSPSLQYSTNAVAALVLIPIPICEDRTEYPKLICS
jgi:hypothetical protein